MKVKPPLSKIEVIEGSVRCVRLGFFGLLPVIGLPASVAAIRRSLRIRATRARFWNPADKQRKWGFWLGCLGLLVSILTALLICMQVDWP